MATVVVDASAVAAVVFGEPEGEAVAGRLTGHRLIAPTLLPYELANVACVKLRRSAASHPVVEEGVRSYLKLGIELSTLPADALVALAGRMRLTPYDAAYLALALAADAELVTLDRDLERAYLSAR